MKYDRNAEEIVIAPENVFFGYPRIFSRGADARTQYGMTADGANSVTVRGVSADKATLKFGGDSSVRYAALTERGAFAGFTSEKIFEETRGYWQACDPLSPPQTGRKLRSREGRHAAAEQRRTKQRNDLSEPCLSTPESS